MTEKKSTESLDNLYNEISSIINEAKNAVYRTANAEMVKAYWNIGKRIIEEEQNGQDRATYGKTLLKSLSRRLTENFGKGFTTTNLKYMRQFYNVFPIGHAVSDQLSWTHYRLLLKVDNQKARDFYIAETLACNWSTRTLDKQIGNLYYQRMLMSKDQTVVKEEAKSKEINFLAKDIIKDPYVLDFLELNDNLSFRENDLEQAIINKLQDFILELGRGFAFVGRQYRLTAGPHDHFYADLVFYNYILKCFLIVDFKIKPLTHQDIGQMDMYVRYFEDKIRQEDDNPTIGLILCTAKNNTIVKYSLLDDNKQIFASKYLTNLPSEKELIEEIERERRHLELRKSESE
jgi:predicted nuclease of restriction endonuclease-like (RecB) superfamily